jgi:DUF4097 and DUF4098 domain-containing protein YvlB
MADLAARRAEATELPRRRLLRARPSPWTALVAVSAVLLLAAAAVLGALWLSTRATSSTSFTALVPGTLGGVEIEVGRGDIEILGGATPDLLVSRVDTSVFGHSPEEQRFVTDGTFRIESSCPDLVIGSCAADYQLTVPERAALTIDAEHGDVTVTAYRGSAVLSTLGGAVTVDAFCGRALDATATSGDIEVVATCQPERLTLRTTTGDITLRVPPGRYSIDADTIGGRRDVRGLADEPDAPARVQLFSAEGDVTLETGS